MRRAAWFSVDMKTYTIATLAAGALSAAVIGFAAPAAAGPGGPNNGQDTRVLDTLGYTVSVDRLGALDAVQRD